ncbi:MAG: ribonuclease HI family protein [Chloroflexi bacterium]|nr:ribonuclease HI family protein [Chloroflexota bacterium]
MTYILQFDGLFQRLPLEEKGYCGIMCYGWLILNDGREVRTGHGGYAHWKLATSNGAEYLALISGLQSLVDMGLCAENLIIQGDSKTTIEQMQKQALTHSPRLQQFHRQARRLCRQFNSIEWQWMPRQQNHPADRLTKQALQQIRAHQPVYFSPDIMQFISPEERKGLLPILDCSFSSL